MTYKWQQPEQLKKLLTELVSWDSRTGTSGEAEFPHRLYRKLHSLPYFQDYPEQLISTAVDKTRQALVALYKSDVTDRSLVLMSHFDTVHTKEYGHLQHRAFDIDGLTDYYSSNNTELPKEVQADIRTGKYIFGRGTMDMKMGLALHMQILEKATIEEWPINIVLVTVPDEEINSAGMRKAVEDLVHLQLAYALNYILFLNSEPSFSQTPNDATHYIYTGSIGKMMPTALFYGKETHAGQPLQGITSHHLASHLTQKMEFNEAFTESMYGETTPLPVCLQQNDLKTDYSTQTSHHSYALYNVFVFNRSAGDVMNLFEQTAIEAMNQCEKVYVALCERQGVTPLPSIKVLRFESLYDYAKKKLGEKLLAEIRDRLKQNQSLDDRMRAIYFADELMQRCSELAPATLLFFTPPFYPAVNSSGDPLIERIVEMTKTTFLEKFSVKVERVHYFNGISDLSYVNYRADDNAWHIYKRNCPMWNLPYSIPFTAMKQLQAPVINIGPFGKDAHKRMERLHKESAFIQLPYLLEKIIKRMFL